MARPVGAKPVPDSEIRAGILAEVARRAAAGLLPPCTTDLRDAVRGARDRVCRVHREMLDGGEVPRPPRKPIANRVKGSATGPVKVRVRPEESEWD